MSCATSPSSPTSTTARPRSSTPCCAPRAPSASAPSRSTGSWTPVTWSARRGSRSSPSTPRSTGTAPPSTSSTPPATPTSAARSSAACRWWTASLLLVDASEGPLPQTRFVLRKTLAAGLPVVLVVNKTDRADARIGEVVDESLELLLELADELDLDEDHTAQLLDLPVVYASGRAGRASGVRPADGTLPDSPDLQPLFDVLLDTVPPPSDDPDAPLQAHVTNLDATQLPRPHRAVPRSAPARSAAASRSRGAVPTAPSPASRSPSCCAPRRSPASRPTARARATSSPSPASRRSRSATPSPTRTTPSRCPASPSTSPRSR